LTVKHDFHLHVFFRFFASGVPCIRFPEPGVWIGTFPKKRLARWAGDMFGRGGEPVDVFIFVPTLGCFMLNVFTCSMTHLSFHLLHVLYFVESKIQ
jgi:hypothetical protein